MPKGPRYSREQSLAILRAERRNRSHSWKDMCLGLVTQAKGYAYGPASASVFGRQIPSRLKHWGLSKAKRGDIIIWITANGWGHIAIYLGDGWVLCNDDKGNVSKIRVSYYAGLGRPFFVDADAPIWGSSGGISPLKPPAAKPAPKPVPAPKPAPAPVVAKWPMRPGQRYRRVRVLRDAFNLPGDLRYDEVLKRRVAQFEENHPQFGPGNGIIWEPEFRAIQARANRD